MLIKRLNQEKLMGVLIISLAFNHLKISCRFPTKSATSDRMTVFFNSPSTPPSRRLPNLTFLLFLLVLHQGHSLCASNTLNSEWERITEAVNRIPYNLLPRFWTTLYYRINFWWIKGRKHIKFLWYYLILQHNI